MKTYINKKVIYLLILVLGLSSCDVDYLDNPNAPTEPPTAALFNKATKSLVDRSRNAWFDGRFTSLVMQYWCQSEYTNEDRYQFRASLSDWDGFYSDLEGYRLIIKLNTDENTKKTALAYGSNEAQIAVARIMMAYTFNILTSTYGDVPYYSYGTDNKNFQALKTDEGILRPKYAAQKDIYLDILKELKEVATQLKSIQTQSVKGDPIYGGDLSKWYKFANSLRLRVAMTIMKTSESAKAKEHINNAVSMGVFTSSADDASLTYETNDKNASPFYKAFYVSNRKDFGLSHTFVSLLKGEDLSTATAKANPFKGVLDPRLEIYAAKNSEGNYVGLPVGVSDDNAKAFKWESLPGEAVLKSDYSVPLMEYTEVEFLLSEFKNWDKTHYENAVRASLTKWGVEASKIATYVASLPAPTAETVMTQKYIALYMQSYVAWTDYRRTGYPKFLVMPNDSYKINVGSNAFDYTFTPLVEGVTDIPSRVPYPNEEQNINGENYKEAVSKLSNGNTITSKLWFEQ